MLSPQEVTDLVGQIVANASKLGLIWQIRPATVVGSDDDGNALVVIDGPSAAAAAPTPATSLIGLPPSGARVFIISVPPNGTYIIGRGAASAKVLTELHSVAASATLTLTTSMQDVVGATVTATASGSGTTWIARAAVDFQWATAASVTALAQLDVDGTVETAQAILSCDAATIARSTVHQQWSGTFDSSGEHTFQLRGGKTNAGGVGRINTPHTTLIVEVYE